MLDQIVDWVIQNKEWFLSGAGVVIIPYAIGKLTAKSGDWISQLWKKLGKAKKRNRQELEEMNKIILGDPLDIAKYYVEPECQDRNPADRLEEDMLLAKNPAMEIVDRFLKPGMISRHGANQMFVLSDAGMGKTSLLTMLKLRHLTAFLPQKKDCVLKKLGEKTLGEIADIENKGETILLLDSLDEDPEAYAQVRERLTEVLHATQHFFRVIITCRTQFFPEAEKDPEVKKDSLERLGLISIAGFTCPVKYLSFFNDTMVEIYIAKRFPGKFFGLLSQKKETEKAEEVIGKMGALRCRPMLLAYIEELMTSPLIREEDNEYQIYNALLESWLDRDKTKKPDISVKNLRYACIILAVFMQIGKKRDISEDELNGLIRKIAKVRPIREIEMKGRSLLNRNSEGHYRFSHYSIQEFLVAKYVLEKSELNLKMLEQPIPMTYLILRMISVSKKKPDSGVRLDCRGMNLSNSRLENLSLPFTDFSNADLSNADLSGCDFCNADFTGANLEMCRLENSKLSGAKFNGARHKGICFKGAYFEASGFDKADMSEIDLTGTRLINSKLKMEFVYMPPGEFMMGDGEDRHKVTLTKGFHMQTTPVTQKQWKAVMEYNPSDFKRHGDKCPVENVSWEDVNQFIEKLCQMEDTQAYRLPTEAEWEYACRAGTETAYCFGDDVGKLKEYAWYDENSGKRTHPVAQLKPNAWGLYDMHGNVWEWCQDWYGDYPSESVTDPGGPSTGSYRVGRGGSWFYDAGYCRAASRGRISPGSRSSDLGLRLALSPPGQQVGKQGERGHPHRSGVERGTNGT